MNYKLNPKYGLVKFLKGKNEKKTIFAIEKIYQEWTAGPLYVAKGLPLNHRDFAK